MNRLAHDLRGPLSPLKTAVFLLRSERLDPAKRVEMLNLIDRQAMQLSAMIDELAEWSRVEQGKLTLEVEECRLSGLLQGIAESTQGTPAEISFGLGTEDLRLQGDTTHLSRLLRSVATLRLARNDDQPAHVLIELAAPSQVRVMRLVSCSGNAVDLAKELLDAPLPDLQSDGLGLDLLLAHAIADAHDGCLRVRAIDPDTVELMVELPLARNAPVPLPSA